jgi:hypothetical protein
MSTVPTRLSDAQLRALTLATRECGVTHGRDLVARVEVAQVTLDSLRRAALVTDSGRRIIATAAGVMLLDTLSHDERVAAIARAESATADQARAREMGAQLATVCRAASIYVPPPLTPEAVRAELRDRRNRAGQSLDRCRKMLLEHEQAIAALDAASADLDALLATAEAR